jgi:hypothetical protein
MYKHEGKTKYYDSNFQAVEEGSPYIAHMVSEGQTLKNAEAEKFGLVEAAKPVEAEAAKPAAKDAK